MEVAVNKPPERGLAIDYITLSSSATNQVFQCDSTYYISGLVSLSQTTTCEGGTVIKYTNYPTAKITMSGPLVLKTGQYRPVILTSKDDDTVGQSIGGSTGSPSNTNGATFLEDNNLQNNTYQGLRLLYAGIGLSAANFSNGVWHCQFVHCGTAINATNNGPVVLRNVLISQCTNAVVSAGGTLSAEHLTADQCTTLLSGAGSSGNVTNTIITAVTAVTNVTPYNSVNFSSSSAVYQQVGAGSYYLADNSTNRNCGTININANLLSDIRNRTTFPPLLQISNTISVNTTYSAQAQRDPASANTDRGFHYDPLDWVFSGALVQNANLTFGTGAAVGTFGAWGIQLQTGGVITSVGSATSRNWIVHYNTVQEQSTSSWVDNTSTRYIINGVTNGASAFSFTDWSSFAGDANYINASDGSPFSLWDNRFHGGTFSDGRASVNATNCLFERVNFVWNNGMRFPLYVNLINDLLFGGNLVYSTGKLTCTNTFFDRTTGSTNGIVGDYNGYITNSTRFTSGAHDQVLTNLNYQVGPLGNYYQATNSGLAGLGNTNANYLGLYQYTATTNLVTGADVKEGNSIVTIGLHYVATDSNGNPIDSNGDGIPDYLSDGNGNGLVDSGEIGWNLTGDLGLKVVITRPRNGAILLP
jgi:hypothetical protein